MKSSVFLPILLFLKIIGQSSCDGDFDFWGTLISEITFFDDIKPSVVNETFPLLQLVGGGFGIPGLNLRTLIRTNLGNLGGRAYTTEFKKRPTVLFAYGWLDTAVKTNVQGLILESAAVASYFSYFLLGAADPYNLIGLNWTAYNQGDFISVVTKLQPIANAIGDQLYQMAFNSSDPVDLTTWHFVGFSLGAHIMGLVARRIKERTNGSFMMPRVTALDPAGPFLTYAISSWIFPHIEKTDAKFIDVIHTNAGGFGSNWKIGHIDFWPNYGNNQPGCPQNNDLDFLFRPQNLCSHLRAVVYYAFSVTVPGSGPFPAVRCTRNFLNKLECSNDVAYMGKNVNKNAREGDYYLMTGSRRDYNLGEAGIAAFKEKVATSGGGSFNFQ